MQPSVSDHQMSMRKMATLDEILINLRTKRAELIETLKQLDTAIKHVTDAQKAIGGNLADLFADEETQGTPMPPASPPTREQGILAPVEVARHARNILIEHGRPLKRGALVRALMEKGVPLAGSDKNKNLGTIMWRHPDMFVHLDGFGYWPKDIPLSGVYDPDI